MAVNAKRQESITRKSDRDLVDMIRNGSLSHAAARATLKARGRQSMIAEADRK